MTAADFQDVLSRDGVMHSLLRRFAQSTMVQIAQGVVCNNAHPVEKRMARWLLTTQDRVGRDEFSLTQEFLGQMLGATRQTVSIVAGRLESSGMITYSRGRLVIKDRRRLENHACHCYGIVHAAFQAMIDGMPD